MDKEIRGIARQVGEAFKKKGIKVVTAESCTGGGLAQAITEIPGSSEWFERGFVTYSNQAKVQMLQVKQKTLNEYGAVSEDVAKEMAEGALNNSEADFALSVTGIAGPNGGSEQKPVGTVFIASKLKGKPVNCIMKCFSGDRSEIRKQTVSYTLTMCLQST